MSYKRVSRKNRQKQRLLKEGKNSAGKAEFGTKTYCIHSKREAAYFAFNLTNEAVQQTMKTLGFSPSEEPGKWTNPKTGDICTVVEADPKGGCI